MKDIAFTKHALQRAKERKLWKYVSKEKFYFDAKHTGTERAQLGECIYAYKRKGDKTYIVTMMHI